MSLSSSEISSKISIDSILGEGFPSLPLNGMLFVLLIVHISDVYQCYYQPPPDGNSEKEPHGYYQPGI